MAETMLIGLEGRTGHFSFGPIRRDAVREIAAVAAAHGFDLGLVEDRAGRGRHPHAGGARTNDHVDVA
jgi:hypothetical protein